MQSNDAQLYRYGKAYLASFLSMYVPSALIFKDNNRKLKKKLYQGSIKKILSYEATF